MSNKRRLEDITSDNEQILGPLSKRQRFNHHDNQNTAYMIKQEPDSDPAISCQEFRLHLLDNHVSSDIVQILIENGLNTVYVPIYIMVEYKI